MSQTAEQYRRMLRDLLPPGQALDVPDGSNWDRLLHAAADLLADWESSAEGLVDETHPAAMRYLLADWERELALPDPCFATGDQSFDQRRVAVAFKRFAVGGQSKQFFVDLAARYGFEITVEDRSDDPLLDPHHWRVTASSPLVVRRHGEASLGELYSGRTLAGLQCLLETRKPAGTVIEYVFT